LRWAGQSRAVFGRQHLIDSFYLYHSFLVIVAQPLSVGESPKRQSCTQSISTENQGIAMHDVCGSADQGKDAPPLSVGESSLAGIAMMAPGNRLLYLETDHT